MGVKASDSWRRMPSRSAPDRRQVPARAGFARALMHQRMIATRIDGFCGNSGAFSSKDMIVSKGCGARCVRAGVEGRVGSTFGSGGRRGCSA